MSMQQQKIQVKISSSGRTAYVRLPGHEKTAVSVAKSVSLDDIIKDYDGPRVLLDFDANGMLIGIEVLA